MDSNYKVVIIGGGSAGILAVSELVGRQIDPILWIDPNFSLGELKNYRTVQTNNEVKYERKLILNNTFINNVQAPDEYLQPLKDLSSDGHTTLNSAYETLRKMQQDIVAHNKVVLLKSKAENFTQNVDGSWTLLVDGNKIQTKYIFWCIGGKQKKTEEIYPRIFDGYTHLQNIPLIDVISQDKVAQKQLKDQTIMIFGRSNTGILALKGLVDLPKEQRPKKIYMVFRGGLRWERNGTIIPSYTQKWYCANFNPSPPEGVELVQFDEVAVREKLSECNYWINAIGYTRNKMGDIHVKGQLLDESKILCDPLTNQLQLEDGRPLKGMFGFGIAFPIAQLDPSVDVDDPVGFFGSLVTIQRALNDQDLFQV